MTLVTLIDARLALGLAPLLDGASLTLAEGERIGLIGRNGSGKSTLLKVIEGAQPLDDGVLKRRDGLRIATVEQEPVLPDAPSLRASLAIRGRFDEAVDPWRCDTRLSAFLDRFALDPDVEPQSLSGGETKRAALALAFALEPDLLSLDEPTNHLDIEAILLLETLLPDAPTSIVITHDRAFLDRVVTRIVELDRGALRSYPGSYSAYEQRKSTELAQEATANRRFDKLWAQEEAWIRKGIEARRTRNEGRVRRLQQLREERGARRERLGRMRLDLDAGERSGRLVAELTGVEKRFGERVVVRGLDLRILRGDRLGIVGPNGAGKSTLLKLILGELEPGVGTVRLGTNLGVAYFDQLRAELDDGLAVAEAVNPGSDWVEVNGERRHIVSYLGDFLFSPQRLESPVRLLSGGERNRLLLAKLFARPANVLVLDEPTNDLDIESLELLEETLQRYSGTLLLVSHDRTFLDNIVTQTVAPLGDGRWREYVGGYSDWVAQRPASGSVRETMRAAKAQASSAAAAPVPSRAASAASRPGKLSYRESRELELLPERISGLEAQLTALHARMAEPGYHQAGREALKADRERAARLELDVEACYERWAALDARSSEQAE
jgi:ATP-binding cassette subfamily F protein uup